MDELWKPIPGYGGHYEASDLGNIRVKDRTVTKWHKSGRIITQRYKGRLLTPCKTDQLGHLVVHLGVEKEKYNVGVHRLVLLAFVGIPMDGQEACHNDGVAWNNRADNLRWDSHHENNKDRMRHGTYAKGEKHPMAKFSRQQVELIKGLSFSEARRRHGISRTHYYRIRNGHCWNHPIEALH